MLGDDALTRTMPSRQGIVEIALRDGRLLRHHTVAVRGTAENPMSRAEVDAKSYDLIAAGAWQGTLAPPVRNGLESGEAFRRSQAEALATGESMNRIVHLALKVEDLERTTEFYQKVFGFVEMNTEKVRDHTSRHLSDGVLDIALIKYDAGTQSAESKAAGEGPCIHHFAVEVDDVDEATEQVKSYGCEIISDPGVIPVKFRAPGGTVCELVPKGPLQKADVQGAQESAR